MTSVEIIINSRIKEWYCEKNGKLFISNDEYSSIKESVEKEYFKEILEPEDSEQYEIASIGNNEYRTTIKIAGDTFYVEIVPSNMLTDFYNFSFKRVSSEHEVKPIPTGRSDSELKQYHQNMEKFEYELTNTSSPIKVLKTVQSILYRFIKKYTPRGIKFKDYDEGSRGTIYGYIATKIAQKSKYFLLETHNWFILCRNEKDIKYGS